MEDAMPGETCSCTCQAQIDKLIQENERLRQTVHTLLMVSDAMNDAVRIWTMPTIPNN